MALTLAGGIARVVGCFWGYPLLLHPDESATVDYAIDMLSRHSWMAASFDRPDHFEIKCDALLFAIFSRLRYGVPAYQAFSEHMTAFYIVGRMLAAAFGTALIPLVSLFAMDVLREKPFRFRCPVALFAGLGVGFLPVFLRYSTLADPDVVLTFFVVLFSWCMLRYLRSGSKKALLSGAALIGLCVTVKYNGAILCLPLALGVIYRALRVDKRPWDILKYGILSALLAGIAVAVIGPNLILEYRTVLANVIREARPNHLGADGLSFWGNAGFYLMDIADAVGRISLLFAGIGLGNLLWQRRRDSLCLAVGAIFWVCISVLKLHWSRWGLPAYPFYLILTGVGLGQTVLWARNRWKPLGAAAMVLSCLLGGNVLLSGLTETKALTVPDTRNRSLEAVSAMGITPENTLYEGYTPFAPADYTDLSDAFEWADGEIRPKAEYAGKRYFMMSDSFYGRYRGDLERYGDKAAVYSAIEAQYPLVYRLVPDDDRSGSPWLSRNIPLSVRYLLGHSTCGGSTISVFDLTERVEK